MSILYDHPPVLIGILGIQKSYQKLFKYVIIECTCSFSVNSALFPVFPSRIFTDSMVNTFKESSYVVNTLKRVARNEMYIPRMAISPNARSMIYLF